MIARISTKHSKGDYGKPGLWDSTVENTLLRFDPATEFLSIREGVVMFDVNLISSVLEDQYVEGTTAYRSPYPAGSVATFTQNYLT